MDQPFSGMDPLVPDRRMKIVGHALQASQHAGHTFGVVLKIAELDYLSLGGTCSMTSTGCRGVFNAPRRRRAARTDMRDQRRKN